MTNVDIMVSYWALATHSKKLKRELGEDIFLLLVRSYCTYLKNFYLRVLEETIYSKRYKGQWEPIEDPGYLEYLGVDPVKDILSVISDALVIEKKGYNFIIRIDPHYKYPGSGLPLIQVLRAIEYGTSKFNARPIFRKITSSVRREIVDLWRGYLTMKGVV